MTKKKSNPELVSLRDKNDDVPPVYNTPVQQKKFQDPSYEPRTLRTAGSEMSINSHGLNFNLTNQGKVIFRDLYDDSDSYHATGGDVTVGSRRRLDTGFSHVSSNHDAQENWARVQQIVNDDEVAKGVQKKEKRTTADGVWVYVPIKMVIKEIVNRILEWTKKTKDAVDELRAESTFAVVTFTSRQAAIAARHCLADGRGVNRWTPIEQIPIPPLADAAAFDLKTCRGCCRPVTLTVNSNQQFIRKWTTIFMLVVIYVFYTVPITFFQTIVQPEKLENLFPGITEYAKENSFFNLLLVGILPALGFVVFFALCPSIFKALSNFGSNAISVNHAELIALHVSQTRNCSFAICRIVSDTSLSTINTVLLVFHGSHCICRSISCQLSHQLHFGKRKLSSKLYINLIGNGERAVVSIIICLAKLDFSENFGCLASSILGSSQYLSVPMAGLELLSSLFAGWWSRWPRSLSNLC